VIVGSGLIGTTSAYLLRKQGHAVTVIDRASGPSLGASFANGGLLTPSMADPWNSPGVGRALLASIGRSDSPMKLRMRAVPKLWNWGIEFFKNSRASAFECNSARNLRLALLSLEVLKRIREQSQIAYGYSDRGTLRIFREVRSLEAARATAEKLQSQGVSFQALSAAQTLELEPALEAIGSKLAGSLHYQSDESGDAYRFCSGLAEQARRLGVDFRFGTEIQTLEVRSGRVTAVVTEGQRFVADKYVVAAGAYSPVLLRKIGIQLPVQPVKGYSLTLKGADPKIALRTPIVDDLLHAAVIPLNDAIRVAGTAEFAGYDMTLRPERIQNLRHLLKSILPSVECANAHAEPWCGLRPVSVDGVPLIGATTIENLLVNVGHGHLGWTLAAGAAQLLTELINESEVSIDPTSYDPKRFRLS
jgi:D-amino-acid dehydrogenase